MASPFQLRSEGFCHSWVDMGDTVGGKETSDSPGWRPLFPGLASLCRTQAWNHPPPILLSPLLQGGGSTRWCECEGHRFLGADHFSKLHKGYLRRTLPILPVLFTLMSLVIWFPSPQQITSSKSGVCVSGGGTGGAEGLLEAGTLKVSRRES